MNRLKYLLFFLLLPFFAKGDDTNALNALLAAGNTTLPFGHAPYSVSSALNVVHSFNLNGNVINYTGTGSELKLSAGITLQGGSLIGSSGSTAVNQSAIQPLTGASGITVTGMTIQNFGQYGLSSTNNSGLSITNCTFRNIGYVAISIITNSGTNTGANISGNTIDRSAQPAPSVPQAAIIVRNLAPGIQTGTVVATNNITMPVNPSIIAAEIIEFRGVVSSSFHDNICTGGSIGCSAISGSNNFQCYNNTFTNQNHEAMECGDLLNSNFHNNNVTSGVMGILVDGGSLCTNDTLSTTTMSSLTGVPIQFDTQFVHGITVNSVTAPTVTNAILVSKGAYGININSSSFTGNNTTYAIKFDNSPGQMNLANSSFNGFTPKIVAGTASSAITLNNIVGNGITPTTAGFLGAVAGTNVTLGSNIVFNALPNPPVPAYAPNSYIYYVNAPISTVTPSNTGGSATSWAITPTQPNGVLFNTATGQFTGTPNVLSSLTNYTVTASNSGGSGTTGVALTIINNPPVISYSPNSQVATIGVAITSMSPANSGGAVVNYTISPALPTGLVFNTATGVISGTASVLSASASYTVTGFNSGGSSLVTITLSVIPAAPAIPNVNYNPNSYTLPINVAISPITPNSIGGIVVSWGISPALPTGLSFSTSTGVVSGTPTINSATQTYDISATNVSGTSHTGLTLTVITVLPQPPIITYNPSTVALTINKAAPLLLPINTGGTATNWTVLPALPTGLTLNSGTGTISGTPTVLTPATVYTVTASNTGGSGDFGITISVVSPSPGNNKRVKGSTLTIIP